MLALERSRQDLPVINASLGVCTFPTVKQTTLENRTRRCVILSYPITRVFFFSTLAITLACEIAAASSFLTHHTLLAQPLCDVEKHVSGPEHPLSLGYQVFQSLRRARADPQDEVVMGGRDLLLGG